MEKNKYPSNGLVLGMGAKPPSLQR